MTAKVPDRKTTKAALKKSSMLVAQYSEELSSEGPPPQGHAPEALYSLGDQVAKMFSSRRADGLTVIRKTIKLKQKPKKKAEDDAA